MAFNGTRKGFTVSRHLQWKSTDHLYAKMRRLNRGCMTPTKIKVANVILGILKSRGERI